MQSCVLAAGRGVRAGGPKAWLPSEGSTLLERQLGFLLSLFTPGDIAISIQEAWLDRCRSLNAGVRWVAVDPGAPALASLQALLRASPPEGWTFVHHVDMPVWDAALFETLAANISTATHAKSPDVIDAVVPVHGGRVGHPVALSRNAAPAVLGLDPSNGRLDAWLRGARVKTVEVPQACVLENWNTGAPRP